MRKLLFKLEVPFYLLVIGMYALEEGTTGLAIVLFILSLFRLWTNSLTNE